MIGLSAMDDLPQITIGERVIAADQPCYVIAEIGVNHNGDLKLAHDLIDAAVGAGADAVKFQTFRTSALVTDNAEKAQYQADNTGAGNQAEMLAALELKPADFEQMRDHCDRSGIDFISTAFDSESLTDVLKLKPKCLKWPSGELTNHAFLREAAQAKLPILLSTGMATLEEIDAAVTVLDRSGCTQLAILQCVSNYPAPIAEQNLLTIPALAQRFGKTTGFSDHTQGPWAALVARGLGMSVLEKHITLDRQMAGPDHAASIEPDGFAEMVRLLREIEAGLGDGKKRPMPSELPTRAAARKSLVFAGSLPAGHTLSESDLAAKRPAGGIGPDQIDSYVGRVLLQDVEADQMLEAAHV